MIDELRGNLLSSITDFGLESIKQSIKEKLDEKKLHEALLEFIQKNKKIFDESDYSDDIDYQRLVDYLSNDLLHLVLLRITSRNRRDRERYREDIVSKTVFFSGAKSDFSKNKVSKFVLNCIDIIRDFYIKRFSKKDFLLAEMIVDDISDEIKSSTDKLVNLVNNIKNELANNNGVIFSYDNAISMINNNGPGMLEEEFKKFLNHISIEHPCYPEFGYDYQDGQLYSKPLTHKAKELYPKSIKMSGKARINNSQERNIKGNVFDYAYRHQLSITMEVTKAQQFLGSQIDPIQTEADKLVGQTLVAFPPAFPPAFPCSIMVGEQVLFEYVLLRTQEITDEGIYIVNNKEQGGSFCIEVGFDFKKLKGISFGININDTSVKTFLHFVKFINALSKEKMIRIHILSCGEDLLSGKVDDVNYSTGFDSIGEELDFLERVCDIEDFFHKKLDPFGEITKDEYEMVIRLSNLIRQEKVVGKWSEATITGIIDSNLRANIIAFGDKVQNLSYIGSGYVTLFGAEFDFKYYKTFESARIFDKDKICKLLDILDDGEEIKVKIVASDGNNTSIESLNIPEFFIDKL